MKFTQRRQKNAVKAVCLLSKLQSREHIELMSKLSVGRLTLPMDS